MTARIGNWMQTVGGRAFYVLDPHPSDVDIRDIAHAASMICRFGGHCAEFYSVAEHCVRVSLAVEQAGGGMMDRYAALLHDAAEAYAGDMIWPLKQAPELEGYRKVLHRIESVVAQKYDLPEALPAIVKRFDLVMLSTEKRDLMVPGPGREDGAAREAASAREKLGPWHSDGFEPLPDKIEPWAQQVAKGRFLDRFFDLRGVR